MRITKKKRVAAAAFTFLMALSSISGATISGPDNEHDDTLETKDAGLHLTKDPSVTLGYTVSLPYLAYQNIIQTYNPGLDDQTREKIYRTAMDASETYQVPLELILAIIACESEFKPDLLGALDDTGLMQVRLRYAGSWAQGMNIDAPTSRAALSDIETNIHMGTYILSYLLQTFDGNLEQALIGYNAGENYVKKKLQAGEELPQHYIDRVARFYRELTNEQLTH